MAKEPLLDRRFLERLERLSVRWQRSFAGLVGGHNRSHFAGGGQEFLDHRHFHQGDDLRAVNWRAYMRLDKMFLKMFQIEPRVPVRLLLDTSVSMAAGGREKFDYALRLAAALCYVGLVRLDTIEVLPFADVLHEGKICGGGRHRFSPLSNFLEDLKPAGSTNFLKVVKEFLNEYPQRGLVIVISDFLDEGDCEKALQYLADYGNELMLIQLWTDEDRSPTNSGEYDFIDAETSSRLHIHVDADTRRRYTEAFDLFSNSLKTLAMRNNGKYAGLPTSAPLDEAIFGALMRAQTVV
ncbi:MAG TPA: DUF58 domain-containing protein [Bryobacteraceae bacterium]|nr:DUF58 domain-containing protein [Bryobacteraceae bacterium]